MLPTGERVPAARRGCSWETRPGVKHPLSPSRETPQKNQKKFVPPEFSVFSAETAAGRGRVSPTPVSRARGGGNPSGTVSAPGAPLSRAWGAVWAGTVRRPGLEGGSPAVPRVSAESAAPRGLPPPPPAGRPAARRGGPCRAVPFRPGGAVAARRPAGAAGGVVSPLWQRRGRSAGGEVPRQRRRCQRPARENADALTELPAPLCRRAWAAGGCRLASPRLPRR